MLLFAIALLAAGLFQLLSAVLVFTRPKEKPMRTVMGRQLEATLGRRGAGVFFVFNALLLTTLAVWMLMRG